MLQVSKDVLGQIEVDSGTRFARSSPSLFQIINLLSLPVVGGLRAAVRVTTDSICRWQTIASSLPMPAMRTCDP